MAGDVERHPDHLKPSKFFDLYFGIFESILQMKEKRIDFFVFEFMEKAFRSGALTLLNGEHRESSESASKKLTMHDSLIQNLCRLLDYKDPDYSKRIVRFLVKFYLLNPLEISESSLNKVICALFITYFDAAHVLNDYSLQIYVNNCMRTVIKSVFSNIEILNNEDIQRSIQAANKKTNVDCFLNRAKSMPTSEFGIHAQLSSSMDNKIFQRANASSMIKTPVLEVEESSKENTVFCEMFANLVVEKALIQIEKVTFDDSEETQSFIDLPNNLVHMPIDICLNLHGFNNGILGWCVLCHKAAHLYSRDHALPICSVTCKTSLLTMLSGSIQSKLGSLKKDKVIEDGQAVLKYLTRVAFINQDVSQETNQFKYYVTKLFTLIFKHAGTVFYSNIRTIIKVRDFLTKNLIDNFANEDMRIFRISLRIKEYLIARYLKTMKMEFYTILNSIVIKVIKSEFSPSEQRLEMFKWAIRVFSNCEILSQAYLNYDLDVYLTDVASDIIAILMRHFQFALTEKSAPFETSELPQVWAAICEGIKGLLKNYERLLAIEIAGQTSSSDSSDYIPSKSTNLTEGMEYSYDQKNPSDSTNTHKGTIHNRSVSKSDPSNADNQSQLDRFAAKLAVLSENRDKFKNAVQSFNISWKKETEELLALPNIYPQLGNEAKLGRILHSEKRFSKLKIGEFFSDPSPFNQTVLAEFLKAEDYGNQRIDDSLRMFFYLFELPAEGQQIDRILNAFALKYASDNRQKISSSCAYGLSFLLMMLQSEWHNSKVPEKMSIEQFFKLARSLADNQKYLSDSLLKELYASVTARPLASYEFHKKDSEALLQLGKNMASSSGISPFAFSLSFLFGAQPAPAKNNYMEQVIEAAKKAQGRIEYFDKPMGIYSEKEIRLVTAEIFKSCLNSSLTVALCVLFRDIKPATFAAIEEIILKFGKILYLTNEKEFLDQLISGLIKLTAPENKLPGKEIWLEQANMVLHTLYEYQSGLVKII